MGKNIPPGGNRQEATVWSERDTVVLIAILAASATVGCFFGVTAAIATFVAFSGVFLPKPPTLTGWTSRRKPGKPRR